MTAWNACLLPWMSDAMATRMLGVIVYSVLKRLRLPVSIVAALVVAEAAVLIMRPRGGIEPVDAEPQTYFSAAFIERAEDFRSGQLRAVRRADGARDRPAGLRRARGRRRG